LSRLHRCAASIAEHEVPPNRFASCE
jgi:hypothetical protein